MALVIRDMTQADVEPVVELLKASLGERLMPKSAAFWNWKHVNNPFGMSPTLVAEDNGMLIAVRAFMQWRWMYKGTELRSLRAVDTAVHPEAQGKGLFSKMTKQLVDASIEQGYDFIFNTPNPASGAGYLKLGWKEVGKARLRMKLHSLGSRPGNMPGKSVADALAFGAPLKRLLDAHAQANTDAMVTALSAQYLQWRYGNPPVAKYHVLHDLDEAGTYLFIFRMKEHKYFREGRLVEAILDPSRVHYGQAIKAIRSGGLPCEILSISPSPAAVSLCNRLGFLPAIAVGPRVTTRQLNLKSPELLESFKIWKPALGDLELF